MLITDKARKELKELIAKGQFSDDDYLKIDSLKDELVDSLEELQQDIEGSKRYYEQVMSEKPNEKTLEEVKLPKIKFLHYLIYGTTGALAMVLSPIIGLSYLATLIIWVLADKKNVNNQKEKVKGDLEVANQEFTIKYRIAANNFKLYLKREEITTLLIKLALAMREKKTPQERGKLEQLIDMHMMMVPTDYELKEEDNNFHLVWSSKNN